MTRYRLLPGKPVFISVGAGDARRFIRRFELTWNRVPHRARRDILQHWLDGGEIFPAIELSNSWTDGDANHAQVTLSGLQMRFNAESFDVMTDGAATWVIAHELAHVFQKSAGKKAGGVSNAENELDADTIASEWGFDKQPYRAWSRSQFPA